MKKILILALLAISAFSAKVPDTDTDITSLDIDKNIRDGMIQYDDKNKTVFGENSTVEYIKAKPKKPKKIFIKPQNNFTEAKILFLINNKKENKPIKEKVSFYSFADANRVKQELLSKNSKEEPTKRVRVIDAFCVVPNNVTITLKDFMKVVCKANNSREIFYLYGEYVADVANFSLYSKPNYIEYDNKILQIDKEKSFVTNSTETSFNIATIINTRAIEKIKTIAIKNVSSSMSIESKNILNDIKSSSKTEETVTDQNGNVVVVQNTQKPTSKDIEDRLFYALVEGALNTITQITSEMQENLPYLFKIEASTLLRAKLFIEEEK